MIVNELLTSIFYILYSKLMKFKQLYEKSKKGKEDVVVIEGVHAFKHAARFGAEFVDVIVHDKEEVKELMESIATKKDVDNVEKHAREISREEFDDIASDSLRTGLIALAKKPQYKISDVADKQIVFIENSRDIDNVGAVVRVTAAYGVGAVCVSGEVSPWHWLAVRAGAGLQWAVPVIHINSIEDIAKDRRVYACDADGESMQEFTMEKNAILVFGTERDGITDELKERSDHIVSIPMQGGVSSLNLATSVAAFLYGGSFD